MPLAYLPRVVANIQMLSQSRRPYDKVTIHDKTIVPPEIQCHRLHKGIIDTNSEIKSVNKEKRNILTEISIVESERGSFTENIFNTKRRKLDKLNEKLDDININIDRLESNLSYYTELQKELKCKT